MNEQERKQLFEAVDAARDELVQELQSQTDVEFHTGIGLGEDADSYTIRVTAYGDFPEPLKAKYASFKGYTVVFLKGEIGQAFGRIGNRFSKFLKRFGI